MKRILLTLLILALAGVLFADDRDHHRDMFAGETEAILDEYRDRTPASLTFGEIEEIAAALSIPAQKAAYVRGAAMASAMIPGLGQFKTGDPMSGTLFLLGDLVISAGTAVGLYFLLPSELQFGQLDYFNTPLTGIHGAWEAAYETATFAEMWPIMGVTTASMILKGVLSHFASRHARELAIANIENGTVTFESRAGFTFGPHGEMGLGFGLKY